MKTAENSDAFENLNVRLKGNRDYTGMWVRPGSTDLMAGKVVFLRELLSPIRVVDLTCRDQPSKFFSFAPSGAVTFSFRRHDVVRVLISRFESTVPLSTRLQLFSSCIQGSFESAQEFAARINKLGSQIFQSSNSAQNTAARNANDQLLQSRFISGLRNDIRRFVLARHPNNLEESINAALIEEQNVKLNQIANDERTGFVAFTHRNIGHFGIDEQRDIGKQNVGEEGRRSANRITNPPGEMPRVNFLSFATQTLILSTNDASISTTLLFATITQSPGIRRPLLKELPVAEEIQLVSDAIRETII
ncbi:hypothetical protein TNCV_4657371 [Trichonephila clavipes]|nr:hypothetical protein TNCV_4657371 [Trichonephila clavipes]